MKMTKRERGLCELYQADPEKADYLLLGRKVHTDRRGFLHNSGLATLAGLVGGIIPFNRFMPSGLIPEALAETTDQFRIPGKDGLIILNDRPINAETPAHLLNDDITPNARHFVRNNGHVPDHALNGKAEGWTLTIDGEVTTPLKLSIRDLREKFEVVSLALQLECGGNGRAAFNPPARGNQWTVGAIGNAVWTGVRYRDVLEAAGLKETAIYTAHFSNDPHLSGDPAKTPISRGMPIAKAMDPNTLIAFEMNGEPLPAVHGFPLRIVGPGWPGSISQKWLNRIWIRNQVHDGTKMTGKSYRVPKYTVEPGQRVPDKDWQIIESMPIKSLITSHPSGTLLPKGTKFLAVSGHAWAGDNRVRELHVSHDFGRTWVKADLRPAPNPYSWQSWTATVDFPSHGYYEIWARATDDQGRMQPFAINWNPKGYLNNSMHRISVRVEA